MTIAIATDWFPNMYTLSFEFVTQAFESTSQDGLTKRFFLSLATLQTNVVDGNYDASVTLFLRDAPPRQAGDVEVYYLKRQNLVDKATSLARKVGALDLVQATKDSVNNTLVRLVDFGKGKTQPKPAVPIPGCCASKFRNWVVSGFFISEIYPTLPSPSVVVPLLQKLQQTAVIVERCKVLNQGRDLLGAEDVYQRVHQSLMKWSLYGDKDTRRVYFQSSEDREIRRNTIVAVISHTGVLRNQFIFLDVNDIRENETAFCRTLSISVGTRHDAKSSSIDVQWEFKLNLFVQPGLGAQGDKRAAGDVELFCRIQGHPISRSCWCCCKRPNVAALVEDEAGLTCSHLGRVALGQQLLEG
eukprot:CAMPEP_0175123776 /NCGR_PEP_ID=MMETSP0087-20121206/2428_1 /TAXON_ID=136419 /ORGANISM="Unknown Unknown, Strain D1" /LENGTH=356 /DNA_ID=CAMNT_0016405499 /DNA_START=293 /DNA_END=1360 /DNA_ORIENTATION=-